MDQYILSVEQETIVGNVYLQVIVHNHDAIIIRIYMGYCGFQILSSYNTNNQ